MDQKYMIASSLYSNVMPKPKWFTLLTQMKNAHWNSITHYITCHSLDISEMLLAFKMSNQIEMKVISLNVYTWKHSVYHLCMHFAQVLGANVAFTIVCFISLTALNNNLSNNLCQAVTFWSRNCSMSAQATVMSVGQLCWVVKCDKCIEVILCAIWIHFDGHNYTI